MPSQESSGSRKRPRSPREDNEKMDAEDEIMATNITAKVGSTPQIEKIFYRKQNDGHFVQTCATPSNPQSVSTHQYVTKSSWSSRGTCNMRVCLPPSLLEESRLFHIAHTKLKHLHNQLASMALLDVGDDKVEILQGEVLEKLTDLTLKEGGEAAFVKDPKGRILALRASALSDFPRKRTVAFCSKSKKDHFFSHLFLLTPVGDNIISMVVSGSHKRW